MYPFQSLSKNAHYFLINVYHVIQSKFLFVLIIRRMFCSRIYSLKLWLLSSLHFSFQNKNASPHFVVKYILETTGVHGCGQENILLCTCFRWFQICIHLFISFALLFRDYFKVSDVNMKYYFNHYPVEFFKWTCPRFWVCLEKILKLVSQQYTACSDCQPGYILVTKG